MKMEAENQFNNVFPEEKKTEESIEALKDVEYPVQQVGNETPDMSNVQDAVEELNPDPNTLSRG